MFVLDEADEMLSRGFKDQIYDIFQLMPPNLQACIASSSALSRALRVPAHVLPGIEHALMSGCDMQVGIFSATLPPDALEITRKFMNKPVR